MNTGASKLAGSRVAGIRFGARRLVLDFSDGRALHVPLNLYPTLLNATAKQRKNVEMIGPGKGFHWPDLDLDLSVDGLVQGMPEAIPAPPRASRPRVRRTA